MPSSYKVIIHEIGYEQNHSCDLAHRFYVLSDGTKVRMPTTIAWCSDCRKVVSVEQVSDVAAIQKVIDQEASRDNAESIDLPDEDPDDFNSLLGGLDEEARMMIQKAIDNSGESHFDVLRWRKARKGPRRCLVCGGHSVRVLHELGNFRTGPEPPTEKTKINIDGEVLTFEVSWVLIGRPKKSEDILYDTEGNLISAVNESL